MVILVIPKIAVSTTSVSMELIIGRCVREAWRGNHCCVCVCLLSKLAVRVRNRSNHYQVLENVQFIVSIFIRLTG